MDENKKDLFEDVIEEKTNTETFFMINEMASGVIVGQTLCKDEEAVRKFISNQNANCKNLGFILDKDTSDSEHKNVVGTYTFRPNFIDEENENVKLLKKAIEDRVENPFTENALNIIFNNNWKEVSNISLLMSAFLLREDHIETLRRATINDYYVDMYNSHVFNIFPISLFN